MKKTMRKISAIVLTVTILVTLAISPANLGVSAEGETTTYQEPYIVTTNPGNVAWDIPEDKNLIKNAGLEKGNTNEAEQSALGTFNNTDGFYRWVSNEVGNVLRTVYVDGKTQPITDYYYLTDEDSHTGNRSLKSAHTKDDWGTFTIYVNVDNTRADRLHDNTNYVFTFWAKTDVATPQYSHYEMIYDPENDKTTHLGDQKNDYDWHMYASKEDVTDGTYDKHSGKYVSGDKNKWKQYSIVFNSGDNAKRIKFRIVGLTGNVYYDDFALYEIDRPIVKDSDYGFYHYSSSANNKTNNLIYDNQNAGMENGTTGWLERLNPEHEKYSEYNPYYSIVTDEKHNGEASLKYYAPQGVAVSPSVKAYNLSHYTNYVFSFWAKGNSNNQNVIKLTFWSNSQSKTLTFWDYSGESSKMATYAINSDDWKQYTFIFNSADSDHFEFWFTGTAVENPIYFDDFTLIPATAMLTYISENNNTIETITSTSQTTNFEYSTFDDAGDDPTKWAGFLYNLNTNVTNIGAINNRKYYSITDEEAHSGTKSFKYTRGDTDDESGTGYYITSNSLEKETEYVLSFWVKGTRGTNDNNWKILTDDVGGNCIYDFSTGNGETAQYRLVSADGWHQYSYRIKTGNYTGTIKVSLIIIGQKNTTLYFDDVSIVKADTVTYTKPQTPVKAKMSSGMVEITKQDNVIYYGVASINGEYNWSTSNTFDWLYANTEYKFAVKTKSNTEIVEGLTLTTYVKGDADYSGAVSIADMIRCYRVVTKATEDTDFNADTDNSGVLDSADIIAIRDILLK